MPKQNKKSKNSQNDDRGREMRRNNLALFIQQFEKEAEERVRDLEGKTQNTLDTVDKFFRVELMKMAPSLKNTRMGDLINEAEEEPASDVSIALKNCIELPLPLRRVASKRLKSTDSPPAQATPAAKAKPQKGERITRTRTRTLPGTTSMGNLRPTTASVNRTASTKTSNELRPVRKPKLRSVVSAGELHCSMACSSAHISVTTREGRTVCFSDETKDQDINLELLDDVAWCQIQRLTTLMDTLSSRCQRWTSQF